MASLSDWKEFEMHMGTYGAAGEKIECNICGDKRPTGFWSTSPGDVRVCRHCALDTLPKLIADACWDECIDMNKMSYYTETILKNYWKAMAINFTRKRVRASDPVMQLFKDS